MAIAMYDSYFAFDFEVFIFSSDIINYRIRYLMVSAYLPSFPNGLSTQFTNSCTTSPIKL